MSAVVFLASAWLAQKWFALALAFVAWGMVAGRGMWGVATVLVRHRAPTFWDQWDGWRHARVGIMAGAATLVSVLCVWAPGLVLPAEAPLELDRIRFNVWPVFAWSAWLVRPWGPVGFTGALRQMGCPALTAFQYQFEAFWKNSGALLGLGALWVAGLIALLTVPWLGMVMLLAWPLVLRCAFMDIFEGGLKLAQPSPCPAVQPLPVSS